MDLNDQLVSVASKRHHRAIKWYKALFYRSLEWAATNLFIMMRGSYVGEEWKRYTVVECKRRLIADLMNMAHAEGSVITFLMSKTDLLLGIKSQRQRPQVDVPVCHRRFSLEQHLIQEASVKLRRCVCHASSQFTKWECGTCLVALHDKCFKRFHTTDDYLDETVHQERLTLKHV